MGLLLSHDGEPAYFSPILEGQMQARPYSYLGCGGSILCMGPIAHAFLMGLFPGT